MKFLYNLLFIIFYCFGYNFILLLFGFLLFFLSHLFHFSWLEQFSVKFIAFYDAPFFGAHKNWIARHCSSSDCQNCRFWTCSGKEV